MSVGTDSAAENRTFDTVGADIGPGTDLDSDAWSPDALLEAGAKVSRQAGWEDQADELEEMAQTPKHERDDEWDQQYKQMMRTVQMIGGAVIGIAVVVIVVNAVLTTGVVNNTTGPFDGVINSLETTGVAAMSLLVVGLLVAAASKLMSFFGGGF